MPLLCLHTNVGDERVLALLEQVAADQQLKLQYCASVGDLLQVVQQSPDNGIILLDVDGLAKKEAVDGVDVLSRRVPVIGVATRPSVRLVVEAMKRGAVDFLLKPLNLKRCADVLSSTRRTELARYRHRSEARRRIAILSAREREVLDLLVEGCAVKQVALTLNISIKTAFVHRARVFQKMKVENVVELWHLLFGNPSKRLDDGLIRDIRPR